MWTKDEVIGRGASGTTWKGRFDGRVVAIKEIRLVELDAKRRELAEREVAILRQLGHEAIPTYLAHGLDDDTLTLVMEFIDGRSLRAEMAERRYDESEVLDIVHELADILDYLHRLSPPVVHRDLKPSNIMRRADGRLALIDFGAVRDHVTVLGGSTVAGTFGYMAPEQFAGDAVPASDLYALGALTAHLLTRKDPRALLDHANRLLWREHATVSEGFGRVLDRLVEADVDHRIQSVSALRQALHDAEEPTAPLPPIEPLPEHSMVSLDDSMDGSMDGSMDESRDYADPRWTKDDREVDELFEPDTDKRALIRRRNEEIANVTRTRILIVATAAVFLISGVIGYLLVSV